MCWCGNFFPLGASESGGCAGAAGLRGRDRPLGPSACPLFPAGRAGPGGGAEGGASTPRGGAARARRREAGSPSPPPLPHPGLAPPRAHTRESRRHANEPGSSAQTQAPHCSMDTPSPDPWPSPLPEEEEKPLALPPPVPRGRRGRSLGGATSSHRTLKASLPRKRGRPAKSEQEPPLAQGVSAPVGSGDSSDLLLIDDQGVPYTVSEGSVAGGPESSGPGPKKAPHFCPVCLRAFPYLSDLERHSISHSELKPHECKDCGKTFKRSSHLRRHCNIHAGLRPFRCPLCPRRFREAGELAHHHRVHSGERPYQCPVCRLRFMETNTLRRHAKRKHPEAMEAPLCPPDPEPEAQWDDDGIPATAGADDDEEELEGKELA